MMIAKTPSLNASIREVGISPTLKILGNRLCRLFLYSANGDSVNAMAYNAVALLRETRVLMHPAVLGELFNSLLQFQNHALDPRSPAT
jgi:hypothetical protein